MQKNLTWKQRELCYFIAYTTVMVDAQSSKGKCHCWHSSTHFCQGDIDFPGIAMYLGNSIPWLPHLLAHLWELTKKDGTIIWSDTLQLEFKCIMSSISSAMTLLFWCQPTHHSASQCLRNRTQCCHTPEWWASHLCKQDTKSQITEICNQWEILATMLGWKCISKYVSSHHFIVESSHKYLKQILQKNLTDAWVHLQWMIFHLQPYDYVFSYCPGDAIVLAHPLWCTITLYITRNSAQCYHQLHATVQNMQKLPCRM